MVEVDPTRSGGFLFRFRAFMSRGAGSSFQRHIESGMPEYSRHRWLPRKLTRTGKNFRDEAVKSSISMPIRSSGAGPMWLRSQRSAAIAFLHGFSLHWLLLSMS
jgi:hypothetical protein